MYGSGYSGMGVNTNMYPQNIYQPGTQLPTLNTGLTSGTTFQNPGGFLQPLVISSNIQSLWHQ